MASKNLIRRLDRLEAELAPPSDEPVLRIVVTSPGEPDEIIEVRKAQSIGQRRPWQRNKGGTKTLSRRVERLEEQMIPGRNAFLMRGRAASPPVCMCRSGWQSDERPRFVVPSYPPAHDRQRGARRGR